MIAPWDLFLLFLLFPISSSQRLTGVFIDCGAYVGYSALGLDWLPDYGYTSTGTSKVITQEGIIPTLATVRTFPLENNIFKKFCYEIPVPPIDRTKKHLIRTTYYYGGVNGNVIPPVFDQIVDGTFWAVVNTTDNYLSGDMTYYEGVFMPTGKNLSVCLAANTYTDSDPFISALEVVPLLDQLYNATDFSAYGMRLIARHSFGHDGDVIGYPDDQFNRYWEPFETDAFPQSSLKDLSVSGIWNLPPPRVFQTRLTRSLVEPLTLLWPPGPLPSGDINYYVALYFADDQTSNSGNRRTMDITINGVPYYNNMTATPAGLVVFANDWRLGGITNLTLSPGSGSTVGPLINAGEIFQMIPAGGKTLARDVIALINLRRNFRNPPADWNGDPCLPSGYAWTGVTCSDKPRIRIVSLNLTGVGLSGSISPSISRLTALTSIMLGDNGLSGSIPDLTPLRLLRILHLENNRLGGTIPPSLGDIQNLQELFVQNNNLTGQVPRTLTEKQGLTFRYSPGNPLLVPPPS